MSDKKLSLGSALKKTGRKTALPVGALIAAKLFTPSIDSDYANAAKDAFYEWVKIPETSELVEKSHPDFRRALEREQLAEKYAWEATEEQLSDPKYMKQYTKRVWDKEIDDPTREQCLVCSKASDIDEMVHETADKLNMDPYKILSQGWKESKLNHKAVSKRRARGDMQIKWIACKEVHDIVSNLDNPSNRHRSYVDSKKDALEFYKNELGSLKEMKERYYDHSDRGFNITVGAIYKDFMEHKSGGNGLTLYLNGEKGYNKNPDKARKNAENYVDEINENTGVFERCDKLRNSVYRNNFNAISAHKDLT